MVSRTPKMARFPDLPRTPRRPPASYSSPPPRLPMLAFFQGRFGSASARIVLVVLTRLLELRKPSGGWCCQRLINVNAAPR
ncbi:hypothetical protein V8C42DRAFT_305424 [Trichoderma barbatum]